MDLFYNPSINTEGILESDTQCLYMTNITEPQIEYGHFYYGPVIMYDLPDTFPVSGLQNFSVQFELVNSNPEDRGVVAVGLFDETLSPVLAASCGDRSPDASVSLTWQYYPRNFAVLNYYFGEIAYDYWLSKYEKPLNFVNATWSAACIHGQGIRGNIPAFGVLNDSIVAENDTEYNRAIKYLGLTIAGYYSDDFRPVPPFRIHDIYLEYEIGGDIDTSPPLLTPQLDRVCILGQTGNIITWKCTDDHPYRYWLFREYDDLLLEEGLWNGSPISVSYDGLKARNYVYKLYLQDKAGFLVGDYVKVRVIEDPFIKSFNSFIRANWQDILILSTVGIACILIIRGRREAARHRAAAWARSLYKQTNRE